MATIFKCDRCHRELPANERLVRVVYTTGSGCVSSPETPEICPRCTMELREWLKPQAICDPQGPPRLRARQPDDRAK